MTSFNLGYIFSLPPRLTLIRFLLVVSEVLVALLMRMLRLCAVPQPYIASFCFIFHLGLAMFGTRAILFMNEPTTACLCVLISLFITCFIVYLVRTGARIGRSWLRWFRGHRSA